MSQIRVNNQQLVNLTHSKDKNLNSSAQKQSQIEALELNFLKKCPELVNTLLSARKKLETRENYLIKNLHFLRPYAEAYQAQNARAEEN